MMQERIFAKVNAFSALLEHGKPEPSKAAQHHPRVRVAPPARRQEDAAHADELARDDEPVPRLHVGPPQRAGARKGDRPLDCAGHGRCGGWHEGPGRLRALVRQHSARS